MYPFRSSFFVSTPRAVGGQKALLRAPGRWSESGLCSSLLCCVRSGLPGPQSLLGTLRQPVSFLDGAQSHPPPPRRATPGTSQSRSQQEVATCITPCRCGPRSCHPLGEIVGILCVLSVVLCIAWCNRPYKLILVFVNCMLCTTKISTCAYNVLLLVRRSNWCLGFSLEGSPLCLSLPGRAGLLYLLPFLLSALCNVTMSHFPLHLAFLAHCPVSLSVVPASSPLAQVALSSGLARFAAEQKERSRERDKEKEQRGVQGQAVFVSHLRNPSSFSTCGPVFSSSHFSCSR